MKLFDRYNRPTPLFWRRIGDTLLLVSAYVTAHGISEHNDTLAYVSLVSGVLGKIITNFTTEDAKPLN